VWRSSGHVSMVAGSKPGRPARQNPSRDCCICMSDPGGKAWSENWWAKPATVRATPAQYRACSGGCLRETDAGLRCPFRAALAAASEESGRDVAAAVCQAHVYPRVCPERQLSR